jgi:hypothetical protein
MHDTIAPLIDQARTNLQRGNGAEALALYRQAADRAHQSGDADMAHCLRHIGIITLDDNDNESALSAGQEAARCWVEARAIYLKLDIASGVAQADRWRTITPQEPPPAQP